MLTFEKKVNLRYVCALIAALASVVFHFIESWQLSTLTLLLAVVILLSVPFGRWCRKHQFSWLNAPLDDSPLAKRLGLSVMALVILVTILPMGLSPVYNGEDPSWRNQYELTADAIINGHFNLIYVDGDGGLSELDNPWDPTLRTNAEVTFHWDNAYYDGNYYMYFGIVPALLVFVPFKLITGCTLVTYHATQFFVAAYLIGLYFLMRLLSRRWASSLQLLDFLLMYAAFGLISTWYLADAPALYCTAIAAAICMEVWSLYFFIRAVWVEKKENRQIALAFVGSLFGALAIGCRPTVAMANLLVLPMLGHFLKEKGVTLKLVGKLVIAALPYIIILGLIMAYNYLRFHSLTEFGQSYQMTVADQHTYSSLFERILEGNLLGQLASCLFCIPQYREFPGVFLEYPILASILMVFGGKIRATLTQKGMRTEVIWGVVVIVLIIFSQAIASPFLLERYKYDILWLVCLVAFVVICAILDARPERTRSEVRYLVRLFAVMGIIASVVLFLVPYDYNFTVYYSDYFDLLQAKAYNALMFH